MFFYGCVEPPRAAPLLRHPPPSLVLGPPPFPHRSATPGRHGGRQPFTGVAAIFCQCVSPVSVVAVGVFGVVVIRLLVLIYFPALHNDHSGFYFPHIFYKRVRKADQFPPPPEGRAGVCVYCVYYMCIFMDNCHPWSTTKPPPMHPFFPVYELDIDRQTGNGALLVPLLHPPTRPGLPLPCRGRRMCHPFPQSPPPHPLTPPHPSSPGPPPPGPPAVAAIAGTPPLPPPSQLRPAPLPGKKKICGQSRVAFPPYPCRESW